MSQVVLHTVPRLIVQLLAFDVEPDDPPQGLDAVRIRSAWVLAEMLEQAVERGEPNNREHLKGECYEAVRELDAVGGWFMSNITGPLKRAWLR